MPPMPGIPARPSVFRVQGFIDLVWCDRRLAFDPEATGTEEKVFLEPDAAQECAPDRSRIPLALPAHLRSGRLRPVRGRT